MKALALKQFGSFSVYAVPVLRLVVGIIFFFHGLYKLQNGPANSVGFFSSQGIPLPDLMVWVVTFLEMIGGIMLILGIATRLIALLLSLQMVGTTLLVKTEIGLIGMQGAGAELDLALLAGLLAILFLGPGKYSVDDKIGLSGV